MTERFRGLLAGVKKKTISINELEELASPFVHTYEDFAHLILGLEEAEILTMVKSKGRTSRVPSLAYQYRIDKSMLTEELHDELQRYRLLLHSSIGIDVYFGQESSLWKEDLPYIKKIDEYLRTYSFPIEKAPAPERSFELVGDEKWIAEKGGKELLERIGLWQPFNIIPVSDPLMFAINPSHLQADRQLHLIVENKTTYQALLPALLDTCFSALIFGSGNKIVKSIEHFSSQYPVHAEHRFLYFGDLDKSGITIWHSLNKRETVVPAVPFYRACLRKQAVKGKGYQRENAEALAAFLPYFLEHEQQHIQTFLKNGQYYPQEIVKTNELQRIWRETDWTMWM